MPLKQLKIGLSYRYSLEADFDILLSILDLGAGGLTHVQWRGVWCALRGPADACSPCDSAHCSHAAHAGGDSTPVPFLFEFSISFFILSVAFSVSIFRFLAFFSFFSFIFQSIFFQFSVSFLFFSFIF